MRNLLLLVGGIGLAAAYFVARKQQQALVNEPVEVLAHRLQDAWADHHTVA